jgi:hypothetical protein
MNTTNNKPVVVGAVGVSGWTLMIIMTLLSLIAFACGVYFLSPNAQAVSNTFGFFTRGLWIGLRVRALVGIVYISLMAYVWFEHVLDTPLRRWPWSNPKRLTLVEQMKALHNNSHVIVLAGILISALLIMLTTAAATSTGFLFKVLTQGVVGEWIGNIFALGIARWFDMKTMDEFRDKVEEKYNDSPVILMVAFKLFWLGLVLSVG